MSLDLFCCSNARGGPEEPAPMAQLERDVPSTVGQSTPKRTVQQLEAKATRSRQQRTGASSQFKEDDGKAAQYMESRIAELEGELAVKKAAEAKQREEEAARQEEEARRAQAKEDAASTIQGAMRGKGSRKDTGAELAVVEKAEAEHAAREAAARSLQGGLRGAKVRKETAEAMREGRERAEALVIAAYKGKATRVNIHNMMMLAEAEVEAEAAEAEAAKRRQAASEEATPQVSAPTVDTAREEADRVQREKMREMEEQMRQLLALQAAQNAALAEAQRDLLQAKQVNKEQKRALHHLKKSDTETVTENSRLKEELQDLQSRLNMSPQPSTIAPSENTDYSRLDVADFEQGDSSMDESMTPVMLPDAEIERSKPSAIET